MFFSVNILISCSVRLMTKIMKIYDHITDTLTILHWLRVPERVNFKLALMAYRVLNGMAPSYLNQLVPVSSLAGRRRLRSSFTLQLLVPSYRLSTVGRRSFLVATSTFWNTLPDDIQSAPSVSGSSVPGWTVCPSITASASRRGGLRSATTSNLVIPCTLQTVNLRHPCL